MAEHCTQLGLPAREDDIFVAKARQVKSSHVYRDKLVLSDNINYFRH